MDISELVIYFEAQFVNFQTLLNIYHSELLEYLLSTRYVYPLQTPTGKNLISHVLRDCSDKDFRRVTRMDRRNFGRVVHILETHCRMIFENNSKCQQEPVSVQLLLFMYFIGYSRSGKSLESCRERHGYSVCMAENAVYRASTSLYSIAGDYIKWPYREERKKMCADIEQM